MSGGLRQKGVTAFGYVNFNKIGSTVSAPTTDTPSVGRNRITSLPASTAFPFIQPLGTPLVEFWPDAIYAHAGSSLPG